MKKTASLTRRQAISSSLAGVFLYVTSASSLADHCLVDISAANPDPDWCHPKPVPTLPGLGLAALSGMLIYLVKKLYKS